MRNEQDQKSSQSKITDSLESIRSKRQLQRTTKHLSSSLLYGTYLLLNFHSEHGCLPGTSTTHQLCNSRRQRWQPFNLRDFSRIAFLARKRCFRDHWRGPGGCCCVGLSRKLSGNSDSLLRQTPPFFANYCQLRSFARSRSLQAVFMLKSFWFIRKLFSDIDISSQTLFLFFTFLLNLICLSLAINSLKTFGINLSWKFRSSTEVVTND